jgi:hypothetical protein
VRIDTPGEADYYRNGGIVTPRVLMIMFGTCSHSRVLARLTRWHVAAGIDGHTRALGLVRAELVGVVPPEGVDATVALLERELHRLRTLLPQVTAVDAALRGRRHRLRL